MLALTCVLVLLVLATIMVRGPAVGPLNAAERLYLIAAPVPAILALVLPGLLVPLMREPARSREWGLWLNAVGGWLSLALLIAGGLLLGRRSRQGTGWDRRLLVGVFVAALPALLIGLVALMYALI